MAIVKIEFSLDGSLGVSLGLSPSVSLDVALAFSPVVFLGVLPRVLGGVFLFVR